MHLFQRFVFELEPGQACAIAKLLEVPEKRKVVARLGVR